MLLLGVSIVGSIIAAYGNVAEKDKICKTGLSISMIANISFGVSYFINTVQ